MNLVASPLALPGCFSAKLSKFEDARGSFHKFFHAQTLSHYLPGFLPREIYLTSSYQGVLRGMHYQVPPHDHAKIVICLGGLVTDVLLDLRAGATYGQAISVELSAQSNQENAVLLPKGIAHGFYAHTDASQLMYIVETEHSPESDRGVLWNSFGYSWPSDDPILSERDQKHPLFEAFSPPSDW